MCADEFDVSELDALVSGGATMPVWVWLLAEFLAGGDSPGGGACACAVVGVEVSRVRGVDDAWRVVSVGVTHGPGCPLTLGAQLDAGEAGPGDRGDRGAGGGVGGGGGRG